MAIYETAPYKVIKTFQNNVELRKYPTLYMATTKTKMDHKMSSGFNNVFQYISGNNEKNEKISMTTPVVSKVEDDMLYTQFMVPTKYGADAPKPTGDMVSIEEFMEGLYMVIKFRGSWNQEHFHKMEQTLKKEILKHGYVIDSEVMVLRYQPPIVPGFLRRNEMIIRVLEKEE